MTLRLLPGEASTFMITSSYLLSMCSVGSPCVCEMYRIWSYSDDPGYSGQPRNNSATTHPSDHISIASQNAKPRIISGALK